MPGTSQRVVRRSTSRLTVGQDTELGEQLVNLEASVMLALSGWVMRCIYPDSGRRASRGASGTDELCVRLSARGKVAAMVMLKAQLIQKTTK